MYCIQNYIICVQKNIIFRFYSNLESNNTDVHKKILMYLLMELLIERKYMQFFYINNIYFNNMFYLDVKKSLYIYLLLQLEEDQNYSLFFIQQNQLYNVQNKFNFKRRRTSFLSFNKKLYSQNQINNSFFLHNINIKNWYKNLIYMDFAWLIHSYMTLFFSSEGLSLRYKSNLTLLKVRLQFGTYDILNYFAVKEMFKNFIHLAVNGLIYNHIPFFVCSRILENDVLLLYSFFLYLKTSILYRTNYLKYIVNFRRVSKFKHNFGLPSFFFILDLHRLLPSLNIVRDYNLPISGFVTSNMNFSQYDYPLFIANWSPSCIYLNYLIVLQLIFFGLQKKKIFFWHFFIKYQVIYILKKKLLDLN